jgi:hypothetical protein
MTRQRVNPLHQYHFRDIQSRRSHSSGGFLHFFAAYGRLLFYCTVTVTSTNHSSGAYTAPTLGYLPSPSAARIHQLCVLYAHKEESGKEFQIIHPGVFRPLHVRAFSGCSDQCIQSQTPLRRRVTTELPVRENFSLEDVVTMCCKCPLSSTRSPRAIADLRADMYCTILRVLGVSRLVNRLIALTQPY